MRPNRREDVWKKVEIGEPDECWEWQGATLKAGPNAKKLLPYGRFKISGYEIYAHRAAYWDHYDEFPLDKQVLHSCDNPRCCNPAHLSLGTSLENNHQRSERGRTAKQVGTTNGMAKLTEDQAKEIISLKGQVPQPELAKRYGVAQTAISKIQTGARWGHLHA